MSGKINSDRIMSNCTLCPRECGADRTVGKGFCGEGQDITIARAELHFWEEPCISGKNGSGTVFFSGCSLKCCFCQNYEISAEGKGFTLSTQELADTFLMLQDKNAVNINLVNPTHFVPQICDAIDLAGDKLKIPVVFNTGGYDKPDTLEMLGSRVKIFLPDLKYFDSGLSKEYSSAGDYFDKASKAIKKMYEIAGKPVFDDNGILKSGIIIRHLVLPTHRHDSIRLMKWIGENFKSDEIIVSIMSQFTPVYKAFEHKELCRKTATFEYKSVLDELDKYGFKGYYQKRSSASKDFIPEFYSEKYY